MSTTATKATMARAVVTWMQGVIRDIARGVDNFVDPMFLALLLLGIVVALLLGWNPTGTDR